MWIELPMLWIGLLNGLGIPLVHLGISWVFMRMPLRWFHPEAFPFACFPGEGRTFYDRVFRVKSWKGAVPDAGPWFGGFAKKDLRATDQAFLEEFMAETCRGEAAHWAQWLLISSFVVWTPLPWAWIILIYAPLSNLPCIVLQRQNRLRIAGILGRVKARASRP